MVNKFKNTTYIVQTKLLLTGLKICIWIHVLLLYSNFQQQHNLKTNLQLSSYMLEAKIREKHNTCHDLVKKQKTPLRDHQLLHVFGRAYYFRRIFASEFFFFGGEGGAGLIFGMGGLISRGGGQIGAFFICKTDD